jgi:hypothetical protein
MKTPHCIARYTCVVAALAVAANAQTPASQEKPNPGESAAKAQAVDSQPGATDKRTYLERTITVTGSARARWEATRGSDLSLTTADSYLVTRVRLGVAFQPVPWLRFYGEAQDARALFYKVNPGAGVSDPFDLRQAYVEGGALEGNGLKLRIGRQDLVLGSSRLIGTGDWTPTKTFDIARATLTTTQFKLDLLGGSQILADPARMDRNRPGERFYVAYSVFGRLIPGASIEPYFMAKTALNVKSKDGKLGDADTLYAGGRIVGSIRGVFEYNFEGVREAGSYSSDVVRAWGYATGGGWVISKHAWRPHLSSDYVFSTGDSGAKDGVHQSFDYLYGLQQPMNSLTGQFSWRNTRNWRAGGDFSPSKRIKVKLDYRNYWLATTMDGLYSASGTRTVFNTKATSGHVGEGIDAQVIVTITGKTVVGFGFGNLAPGSYLKQSGKTTGYTYPSLYLVRQI